MVTVVFVQLDGMVIDVTFRGMNADYSRQCV